MMCKSDPTTWRHYKNVSIALPYFKLNMHIIDNSKYICFWRKMSFNIMINSHSQCCGIHLRNIAFSLTFLSEIKPRKLTYKFGTFKKARFPNLTHIQT